MGGGRIDCYLDIASLFSYVAFVDLIGNLDTLAAHGVKVEFHPVFLGGIMQASGNRPPWMLPAKAKYLSHDSRRAMAARGITDWASPPNLMELARTQSPLRALHYIKANFPPAALHATLAALFRRFWAPPHANFTDDAVLAATLAEVVVVDDGGGNNNNPQDRRRFFSDEQVRAIMAARDGMKDSLKEETGRALELGAFGAPWIWVTNEAGKAEPFFGSDRFAQIYKHLGIAYQDVKILDPGAKL
ncbi:Dihydrofolate reductase [Purpureocillium takamizusanense]|uniref:Dihydrofolate reductase n=1 Tax=Purpureocillium takamizusanense TaxID=2060973 RepID=A0A9Q8V6R8_9HYPO|nr:Dihydrofolate reductase [Purpureocillium takamizusanense]UNI14119.1 Dihydrofolate reductase [Purpureocillium takamizusanense]